MFITNGDYLPSVNSEFGAMIVCIDIAEARANAALALTEVAKKEAELALQEARIIHKVSMAMVEAARKVMTSQY